MSEVKDIDITEGWDEKTKASYERVMEYRRNNPRPEREFVAATQELIADHFGFSRLGELTTEHMNAEQAEWFDKLLDQVRAWKETVVDEPGLSFVLCSPQVGIGKTHIAKAVKDSFSHVYVGGDDEPGFYDGAPNFQLSSHGRILTGREVMAYWERDSVDIAHLIGPFTRCFVIDDMGREGTLKYVKADYQPEEKRSRYFELLNWVYENRSRQQVSVFVTSNMTLDQLRDFLGAASWSRLNELAPVGYMVEAPELPDMRMVKSGRGIRTSRG